MPLTCTRYRHSKPYSRLRGWNIDETRIKSKRRVHPVVGQLSTMPLRIEIRSARPEEIDVVLEILDEAAAWIITNNLPSVWKPGEFQRQTFLDQISRGEVYLASVDNVVIATFVLQWSDTLWWGERPPDSGYFHKFAVKRSTSGQGIGSQILKWAEAKTRAEGKKYLRLNCIAADRKIRDYYEKAGFGHVGDVMGSKALASLYEKLV